MRRQPRRHAVPLRPGGRLARVAQPRPRLDHVRHAHPEPRRHRPRRAPRVRQNALAQVLSERLPLPPAHRRLRSAPETQESHRRPVPEAPIRFQPSRFCFNVAMASSRPRLPAPCRERIGRRSRPRRPDQRIGRAQIWPASGGAVRLDRIRYRRAVPAGASPPSQRQGTERRDWRRPARARSRACMVASGAAGRCALLSRSGERAEKRAARSRRPDAADDGPRRPTPPRLPSSPI